MSIDRHDIYSSIHKAIRGALSDNLILLGQVDFADTQGLRHCLSELRDILEFCTRHIVHENNFIHPAIVSRSQLDSLITADQHVEHDETILQLYHQIDLVETCSVSSRETAINKLYSAYAIFVAENLVHMGIEESHNNQLLWENYSDEEILSIEQALVNSLSPREHASSMKLMMKYFSHQERVRLLSDIKKHAPIEVFDDALAVCELVLSAQNWVKLIAEFDCQWQDCSPDFSTNVMEKI